MKFCEEIWVIVRELGKDDKNYFYNMILYFDLIVVKRDKKWMRKFWLKYEGDLNIFYIIVKL